MIATQRRSAVLMYHELGAPRRRPISGQAGYVRYVIPAESFARQVHIAQAAGGVRSLAEALDSATGSAPVITFDDGCETDLLLAAPSLLEARAMATFFVTTSNVGQTGYLSRAQVRELAALGFEVGAHGHTHRYLSDLPAEELDQEVRESRDRLQEILGARVRSMSCPGGRWSPAVARAALEAGYDFVATSERKPLTATVQPDRVPRYAITSDISTASVARMCAGQGESLGAVFRSSLRTMARDMLGPVTYDRLRARWLNDGPPDRG